MRLEKLTVCSITSAVNFLCFSVTGLAYAMGPAPQGGQGQVGGLMLLGPLLIFFILIPYLFYKYVNGLVNIVLGIVILGFRIVFFKELPLIGTVYSVPGESIFKAEAVDARVLMLFYLFAGIFISIGAYRLYVRKLNTIPNTSNSSSNMPLDKIKEAKQLLDEGSISEDEFNRIKEKVLK